MSKYTKLVPVPSKDSMNTGLSSCPTSYIERNFGAPVPRKNVTSKCQSPTVAAWKRVIKTRDVGPFQATGHVRFLEVLAKAFATLENANPDLYARIGNLGCLCVRWVRGKPGIYSNHSWGLAIDLTIDGILDERGDDKVQAGLLEVYAAFKKHKLFWGAEFQTEDGMHFEASSELVMEWIRSGTFMTP